MKPRAILAVSGVTALPPIPARARAPTRLHWLGVRMRANLKRKFPTFLATSLDLPGEKKRGAEPRKRGARGQEPSREHVMSVLVGRWGSWGARS